MHPFILLLFLIISLNVFGQQNSVVWVDLVKVKDGHHEEAVYFYEKNWKLYRDSALKAGHIKSYRLVKSQNDSAGIDIILQTEYYDMDSYQRREEFFQPIMKALRPNGPILMNALKREEILTITQSLLTRVVF